MYRTKIGNVDVECDSAQDMAALACVVNGDHEVREIAQESIKSMISPFESRGVVRHSFVAKPTKKRHGLTLRWAKARRYAKKHGVSVAAAFKLV